MCARYRSSYIVPSNVSLRKVPSRQQSRQYSISRVAAHQQSKIRSLKPKTYGCNNKCHRRNWERIKVMKAGTGVKAIVEEGKVDSGLQHRMLIVLGATRKFFKFFVRQRSRRDGWNGLINNVSTVKDAWPNSQGKGTCCNASKLHKVCCYIRPPPDCDCVGIHRQCRPLF